MYFFLVVLKQMQLILDMVNFLSRALLTCLGKNLALAKIGSLMKVQSAENPPASSATGLNSAVEESFTYK